ncbi:MAG: hypothetical protein J0665_20070 [Deltaproteobacteria bacterium]|nr:hypothetical protein [Deltaproteobacteria bacterium]
MQKKRYGLIALSILLGSVTSAKADISFSIGLPSVSIGVRSPNMSVGINLSMFPQLAPVPGYPVYYAPQVNANYFFYDGMYWVYQDDNWYASTWYNGPWDFVEPEVVPLFVLRIPVCYYRQPPVYFRGWQSNAPPRWDQHWGPQWQQRRGGWDRWNRKSVPSRAPLPVYQRQFSGDRYPHQVEQQHKLRSQSYRYQPRDKAVQQQFKRHVEHRPSAPVQRDQKQQIEQRQHNQRQQVEQRQHEQKQQVEQKQHEQKQQFEQRQHDQRKQVEQKQHEQRKQVEQKQQREQQAPRAQERGQKQDRGDSQEHKRGRGQDQDRDDNRGHGRDK